jgi:hypothetical protein
MRHNSDIATNDGDPIGGLSLDSRAMPPIRLIRVGCVNSLPKPKNVLSFVAAMRDEKMDILLSSVST